MKQKSHEKTQIKVSCAKKTHGKTSYINICHVGSKGARKGHLDQDFLTFVEEMALTPLMRHSQKLKIKII